MRAIALLLALPLLVAGCTGDDPAQRAAGGAPRTHATASAKPSPQFSVPAVTMFAGLDAEKGILTVTCARDVCRTLTARTTPKRYLPGVDTGLVTFTTGRPPRKARLQVRRATRSGLKASPLHEIKLTPKTLMAATVTVDGGRYVLTLIGEWPGREARWIFGLAGPSGR